MKPAARRTVASRSRPSRARSRTARRMRSKAATPQSRLDAWRDAGADRVDPLRFSLMRALADRAERHDGLVRQRLDARLAVLADAYADTVAKHVPVASQISTSASPLSALLQ